MEKEVIKSIIEDMVKSVLEETGSNAEVTDETIINAHLITNVNDSDKVEFLSSLQIVTLIVSIENRFDIEISDEAMFAFKTINDLVDLVDSGINVSLA